MNTKRAQEIIGIIIQNSPIGITEIRNLISDNISVPTLNRELAKLKNNGLILPEGYGPNLKYSINLSSLITFPIEPDSFFSLDPDQRKIIERFNFEIFDKLKNIQIFTEEEKGILNKYHKLFQNKTESLSENQFKKEFERLMIELSWKSSQIEGNTYDLIDTEQLLKYNISSEKHSTIETQMLLNHKTAINYTYANRDMFNELNIRKIIEIHTLLTEKMGISKNPRKRIVRITGTRYKPLENEFLIEEALEKLCDLINNKSDFFEKTFLSILIVSYIQPFEDGNKRTARLTGNAFLMFENSCPLSYRSIKPADYTRAILMFYEMNNISAFKKIFIDQFKFAVENYF